MLTLSILSKTKSYGNFILLVQDRIFKLALFLAVLFFLATLAVLSFSLARLPQQVPLFYSLPWGESQLADAGWLWFLPALEFLILILNLILATSLDLKEKILARFLSITNIVFNLLILVTLIKIIFLVGR